MNAGSSFSASRRDATRRMSATELVSTPSQLRRSSAARTMSGRRGIVTRPSKTINDHDDHIKVSSPLRVVPGIFILQMKELSMSSLTL